MGKMELEMKLDTYRGITRYASYYSEPPSLGFKHIDKTATMQLFIKELQNTAGGIPLRIRVTVEWEDPPTGGATQD